MDSARTPALARRGTQRRSGSHKPGGVRSVIKTSSINEAATVAHHRRPLNIELTHLKHSKLNPVTRQYGISLAWRCASIRQEVLLFGNWNVGQGRNRRPIVTNAAGLDRHARPYEAARACISSIRRCSFASACVRCCMVIMRSTAKTISFTDCVMCSIAC
jgi:hypothetical protein